MDTQELARRIGEALKRRDRKNFVAMARDLLIARPAMNSGYKALAQPLLNYGELSLARRSIDLFVDANDGSAEAKLEQALIYTRAVGPAAALDIVERLPDDGRDPGGRAYLEGTIALNLGDVDRAERALLRSARLRPDSGAVMLSLSAVGSMAERTEAANEIVGAAARMSARPSSDRGPFQYALGKVHADRRDHRLAFQAFSEGAAILRAERPYDPAADRRLAGLAMEGWTRDAIELASRGVTRDTSSPLFVTGLPRSGSTLVEQILTSHSEVGDGEEIGRFSQVVMEIGGVNAPRVEEWLANHTMDEAAALYLHLFRERFPGRQRAVDKTLEASRYMGILAAAMPDAPIIWLRRNPIDNAWSAFRTYFLRSVDWSWSLEDIADHFALEDKLHRFWTDVLGDRILTVHYEELVADKDTEIARILAHCGLAPEEAAFHPERNERPVTTNSVTQVRAPINASAVRAAEPYLDWLGPFVDRYERQAG